ncbi:MAG TPA: pantoate--beta-alanine ligase [Bacteroidia bacterium]|jgi:pantoate--beta-alanine ligase
MKTFNNTDGIQAYLLSLKAKNKRIGFVPTMGALHPGHISLIEQCRKENEVCVASIFVNPTQFNDKEDLERYPRTLGADSAMLERAGCDVLFAPPVEEVYPQVGINNKWQQVDLGELDSVMEGAHRPGHFKGVIQVVSRLFDIVEPHRAYFGQKDFQQLAVIREMTRQLNYPVQIIACPTMRENDGLAMSSRNMRLTPGERKEAPKISRVLFKVKELAKERSVEELKRFAVDELNKEKLFTLEYFEIADAATLQPAKDLSKPAVACVALKLGAVRLIDNISL